MDCIFCKIRDKEIPTTFIREDGYAFAMLDIHPRAAGHTMVIPKTHAPTILDLPNKEVGPVFQMVKDATARLEEVLHPDGFTIGVNHGESVGQGVPHLHIHILPRWKNDGGGNIHSVVNNPGTEDITELTKRLAF